MHTNQPKDRQIGIWSTDNHKAEWMMSGLGGFAYSLSLSSLSPSLLAIGVGDDSIVLWETPKYRNDQQLSSDLYDTRCLWKGIQSKVTCVLWHPTSDVRFTLSS